MLRYAIHFSRRWVVGTDRRSDARLTAFAVYLRTGRRVLSADTEVETKFNPWHDPENGRFTFAGRGRYFARGSRVNVGRASRSGVGRAKQHLREGTSTERLSEFDPKNPRNHSIYTVKKGDTLTSIATQRRGLTAADLAWLNDLPPDRKLQIGQKIKLPHQQYLEAGRRARDKFLALSLYIQTHEGRLPPDVANPPTIAEQLDSNWRKVTKNGYNYQIDPIERPRDIRGELSDIPSSRSRSNQARAGGKDRRPRDDGGHYIAARFNGPRDSFNHFAQDASFNRGEYRALEDVWAKHLRAGSRVSVHIVPRYHGASVRPYKIIVTWVVDGRERTREFQNEKKGK